MSSPVETVVGTLVSIGILEEVLLVVVFRIPPLARGDEFRSDLLACYAFVNAMSNMQRPEYTPMGSKCFFCTSSVTRFAISSCSGVW